MASGIGRCSINGQDAEDSFARVIKLTNPSRESALSSVTFGEKA
jgi:hypothetical protein